MQQQQNTQTFVDQLRKLIPSRTQPDSGAQRHPWEEWDASPATLPQIVWPAPGAGDFETVRPAAPPRVYWPALGAGDYLPVVIPDALPSVIWPAPGAGDFQTVRPAPEAGLNLNVVIPELLPSVVWSVPGVGDFQTARPVPETGLNRNGVIPALLDPADNGKTDLIRVPEPADDCPLRLAAGPC